MRVLVLGAAGVIGSAVVRRAVRDGFEAHAVARDESTLERLDTAAAQARVHRLDLRDRAALSSLIATLAPDAIVHAAFPAVWGRDPASRAHLFADGLGLSANLAEALRERRFAGSLVLRLFGSKSLASFVGQLTPTFLIAGLYNKLTKVGAATALLSSRRFEKR